MKKAISVFILVSLVITMFMPSLTVSAASNDVVGIRNGQYYYIKNVYTERYLTVEGGAVSVSGTNVCNANFTGNSNQKWLAVRNSDGSYTFKPSYNTNYALDVTGTNVDIWSYTIPLNCQKFYLERQPNYDYSGTYFIKNKSTNKWVNAYSDNVCVSIAKNTLTAMWSFIEVTKGDADIYASYYKAGQIIIFPYYYDTRGAISTFHSKLGGIGYNTYDFVNAAASTAYNYMQNDSIFVTRGHGSPATVYFFNSAGSSTGRIIADSSYAINSADRAINSLPANALAKLKCVLYIGCSPGDWYEEYSLIRSTFDKGAHFVLGPKETIYTVDGTSWTKYFLNKAYSGGTIRQCIDHANYYEPDLGAIYYLGDTFKTLK